MEETDDIVITKYRKKYYADLVKSGYFLEPFHWMNTNLKPDLYNRMKNLLNRKEMEKSLKRAFLLDEEEIILVAYSTKEKKAIASIILRRITDRLWGIWAIFVAPSHRGRRIASSLYKETFRLLKKKNVKKTVGRISKNNVASIKAFERSINERGFLRKRIFECKRIGSIREDGSNQIMIRNVSLGEDKSLFRIFKACLGRQWCSFLEINEGNYLDRIYGPCYFEEYKNPLSRLVMKKDVFVAESKGEIKGYAIARAVRLVNFHYALHLFVPISKDFDNVCRALLIRTFRPLNYRRKKKFILTYIGDEGSQDRLKNLGFEVQEALVAYHFL